MSARSSHSSRPPAARPALAPSEMVGAFRRINEQRAARLGVDEQAQLLENARIELLTVCDMMDEQRADAARKLGKPAREFVEFLGLFVGSVRAYCKAQEAPSRSGRSEAVREMRDAVSSLERLLGREPRR